MEAVEEVASLVSEEVDFTYGGLLVTDGGNDDPIAVVPQQGAHAVSAQDELGLLALTKELLNPFEEECVADLHRASV